MWKPGKPCSAMARHVGRLARARAARHRQHADQAGARLRQRLRDRHEHRRDVPGDEVGERGRRAAIAHIGHFEAGALEKQRHQEIARAAGPAAAGIGELFFLRFHIGDEFRDGPRRKFRIHDQHLRRHAEQADRRKVLHRVVADLGDRGEDGDDGRARPQQRVAIRGRAGDRLGREDAVAADAVFDHELLAERLAQARGGEPAHHVDIAARCERHQHLHRPLRPSLCASACSARRPITPSATRTARGQLHHAVTQIGSWDGATRVAPACRLRCEAASRWRRTRSTDAWATAGQSRLARVLARALRLPAPTGARITRRDRCARAARDAPAPRPRAWRSGALRAA